MAEEVRPDTFWAFQSLAHAAKCVPRSGSSESERVRGIGEVSKFDSWTRNGAHFKGIVT
jgi:hypothetical protein